MLRTVLNLRMFNHHSAWTALQTCLPLKETQSGLASVRFPLEENFMVEKKKSRKVCSTKVCGSKLKGSHTPGDLFLGFFFSPPFLFVFFFGWFSNKKLLDSGTHSEDRVSRDGSDGCPDLNQNETRQQTWCLLGGAESYTRSAFLSTPACCARTWETQLFAAYEELKAEPRLSFWSEIISHSDLAELTNTLTLQAV